LVELRRPRPPSNPNPITDADLGVLVTVITRPSRIHPWSGASEVETLCRETEFSGAGERRDAGWASRGQGRPNTAQKVPEPHALIFELRQDESKSERSRIDEIGSAPVSWTLAVKQK
jgi:hypothetical protein